MKTIRIASGTNLYDFFVIPTIRFNNGGGFVKYLTVEWLKWYVGISWE